MSREDQVPEKEVTSFPMAVDAKEVKLSLSFGLTGHPEMSEMREMQKAVEDPEFKMGMVTCPLMANE